MIAPALLARRGPCFAVRAAAAFILVGLSVPAAADVGATASLFTEARFRGISLSGGDPVGQLDLSYDDPSGFYGSLSGSLLRSSEYGIRPLALQENVGYAKRLENGPTIDVGIINSHYSRYSAYQPSNGYTEIYAGLIGRIFSSHIYLAPNHYHWGHWAAYGEVDAGFRPARKLRLTAHIGSQVRFHPGFGSRIQYDWRIGASREIGPVSLHVALSDGGPGRDYYDDGVHRRRALIAGATFVF